MQVSGFETKLLNQVLHVSKHDIDPMKPIYFSTKDYVSETWNHACHLHKTTIDIRLKSAEHFSFADCATFNKRVCCYVDKFGWMPVYENNGNDGTFHTIRDMGQHDGPLPLKRKLNACPKIGVTNAPTKSPTKGPTRSPSTAIPTSAPMPTPAPTNPPVPTVAPPPTTPSNDDDTLNTTLMYGGVSLAVIIIGIASIEFGPGIVQRIQGNAYVRPLP